MKRDGKRKRDGWNERARERGGEGYEEWKSDIREESGGEKRDGQTERER